MLKTRSKIPVIVLSCFIFVFALVPSTRATLKRMKSEEMHSVTAQAGINIALEDAAFYDEFDSFILHDSDMDLNGTDALILANTIIGNGQGWGYNFSTNSPLKINMVEYDPFLGGDTVALKIACSDWEQNINYNIDNFKFCGKDLGSLEIGQVLMPSYEFQIAPPYGDESGILFKNAREYEIEKIIYNYNNADDQLLLKDLHMAESFSGDPTNPDAWTAQGKFQTGSLDGDDEDSFAKFNVIEENDLQKLRLDIPTMQGSIRLKDIQTPEQDMGPVVIDGINVHNLEIKMTP